MRFEIEQHFDGSLADVETAFVDPGFLESLASLPKLGAPVLLDQHATDATVTQRVAYRFVGDVNAAVRRVVDPARLTWVEESTLDRATHVTTWRIVPDHYANMIRCSGTFTLAADGDRTRRTTEADMRVSVPLVGGRVERAIVSGLREHAGLEESAMADWLRRQQDGN